MQTFTVSIDLDADQIALVETIAAFFGMDMRIFLEAALVSGIAHAESMARADMARAEACGDGLVGDHDSRSGELDDDLPF